MIIIIAYHVVVLLLHIGHRPVPKLIGIVTRLLKRCTHRDQHCLECSCSVSV